jgi:hypothetical protein
MPPSLDGCTACGAAGLYAPDEGGEWAVELGPVASERFRTQAVRRLEDAGLIGLDPAKAKALLATRRVRAAELLNRDAADQLALALDTQGTQARAVTGPRGEGGSGGRRQALLALAALAPGILLGLLWSWIWLAAGALLAVVVWVAMPKGGMPVLGMLPTAPHLAHQGNGLLGRGFAAAGSLSEPDAERAKGVLRAAFRLYATLDREDHMAAQLAGGVEGGLGKACVAVAREVSGLAARHAGGSVNDAARGRLERLRETLEAAEQKLQKLEHGEVVEVSADQLLKTEMEALGERLETVDLTT